MTIRSTATIHHIDDCIARAKDVARRMARNGLLSLVLAFAVAGALLSGALAEGGCRDDALALVEGCKEYVEKQGPPVPPSAKCCSAVQHADIPCVCTYVTPALEKDISMEKALYVAEKCGRPFKHGSKCGSYTVPRA